MSRDFARRLGLQTDKFQAIRRELFLQSRTSETWVEAPIGEEWTAAYRLVVQNGFPVVAELRIFPAEPGRRDSQRDPGRWGGEVLGAKARAPRGGITARLLRQVKVGEHYKFVGDFLRWVQKQYGREPFGPDQPLGRRGLTVPASTHVPERGRRGRSDADYARVAAAYVEAFNAGSRHPVVDAAQALRAPPARMRDMVHQARCRGLLTPSTKQGRRGGQLTPRACALLKRPIPRKGAVRTRGQAGGRRKR